jgi:hypothetical protein
MNVMKKTLAVMSMLFLVALSVDAFAIGNIGAPTAELKAGQWSIGGDYAYSDIDLDTGRMKYTDSEGGSGKTPFKLADVKTNFYYVTLGYGLSDNLEVYGRLGIADIKGKLRWSEYHNYWEGGNFDNDLVWGVGTKFTFYKQGKVRWGATSQMSWIDTSLEWKEAGGKETVDLSAYDLLVAVGPTVDMGGWKLYGGPFFYMVNGDADDTYTEPSYFWKGSADVEEDSSFGGYIGAAIPLAEKIDMTFEVAAISDGWAAGTGVIVRF